MTKQEKQDYYLLSLWAGAAATSISHGYASVRELHRLTDRQARRRVHKALDRMGYNAHTGPTLIQAWLELHRKIGKEDLF